MAKKKVVPIALGNKVVIESDSSASVSPGGIALPEKKRPDTGKVVSQGPLVESTLVGRTVVFSPYDGTEFEKDGVKYLVFEEDKLLAALE